MRIGLGCHRRLYPVYSSLLPIEVLLPVGLLRLLLSRLPPDLLLLLMGDFGWSFCSFLFNGAAIREKFGKTRRKRCGGTRGVSFQSVLSGLTIFYLPSSSLLRFLTFQVV